MADVLIYDTDTGRARDFLPSVHTPDYEGRPDVLVNPELTVVDGVPRDHWLVDAGEVREMTQTEKDALAAEREAAAQAADDAAVERGFDPSQLSGVERQLAKLLFRLTNEVRELKGQQSISSEQFIDFVKEL